MEKKVFKVKLPPKTISEHLARDLDDDQRPAVLHAKGPALIIAGAGSGKTRTLTYRVAHLIENGTPPSAIVLVTFTKKAAAEMTRRAEGVSGGKTRGMIAGTFHHVCNLYLRKYAQILGYTNNFSILDPGDQRDLLKLVIGPFIPKDKEKKTRYPKASDLAEIYSTAINQVKQVDVIVDEKYSDYHDLIPQIKRILQAYHDKKRATNVMDFDDLLVNFLVLLRTEGAGDKIRQGIRHVLVDEFQDVNAIQADLVYELSRTAESLAVVGDDAQAIYSFRGADFKHMLNFPTRYPGTKSYKLEHNYRSRPEILALANTSIAHNQKQFPKTLRTTRSSGEKPALCPCANSDIEALFICQKILQFRDEGTPLHEQAVLFRSNQHRLILEHHLVRMNIPYEVRAGIRFFEQAHIKDCLAYLFVMTNPKEEVQWMRLLTMHPGVGDTAAQKVLATFIQNPNPLEKFVTIDFEKALQGLKVRADAKVGLKDLQIFLARTICDPQSLAVNPPDKWPRLPELVEKVIKYIKPFLEKKYKDWQDRVGDLRELGNFTTKYHDVTAFLSDILTTISVKGETIEEGADADRERPLVLSTIHQAKGLEWQVVYILNCTEGGLPSSFAIGDADAIEEERRLFYVACTRAKDFLFISYPQLLPRFYVGDVLGRPSSFIEEIREKKVFDEWQIDTDA